MEPRFLTSAGGLLDYVNGNIDRYEFNENMINFFLPRIRDKLTKFSTKRDADKVYDINLVQLIQYNTATLVKEPED